MSNREESILNKRLASLTGIGPERAETMQKELNLFTIRDLLELYPYRYIDKTEFQKIAMLHERSGYVQLQGQLVSIEKKQGKNRRYRLEALLKDSSGFLTLMWFQKVKIIEKYLEVNEEYNVFGKVGKFGSSLNIIHPELEKKSNTTAPRKTFDPVYSSTEKMDKRGLDTKFRRGLVRKVLERLRPADVEEILPTDVVKRYKLVSRYQALKWVHFPQNENQKLHAYRRLKFEELFMMQLKLLWSKRAIQAKLKGAIFSNVGTLFRQFYDEVLEFELTGAQKRVLKEIRSDVMDGTQMNRLLQGDVGAGKTIVAFMSMLLALDNGFQACIMAPTEILAQQHAHSIQALAEAIGIHVALLTGSIKGTKRKDILDDLKSGKLDIIIGTHALIEDTVVFHNLGLVVIDEQHRFGVAQRARLWKKNKAFAPHILIMTATPIPRTLSMTVFGDLDVSIIDELPPGRKPVTTVHHREKARSKLLNFMKAQIAEGRQIYIVYPLIEESETLDLKNLQDGYERLRAFFPPETYQISVVHGRMKPQDKEFEMQRFVRGETHIMVATTVIEVGVNVPNATVMVIENAERFGLSQLHQLRGRVGRGAAQSFCILMTGDKLSKEAIKRLRTMTETNDGFKIAEVDLELRGPGDIAGVKQSGIMDLKLSNIIEDQAILKAARDTALSIIADDPKLESPTNQPLRIYFSGLKGKNAFWGRIS